MRSPSPGWAGPLRWDGDGDDCTITPLWDLVDGEAQVVDDATDAEARTAWERAAIWTQADVDEAERFYRVADAGRTRRLLAAYRAALQDLRHRHGAEQGHRGSAGVQLFFNQVGLQLGMHPIQVAHRVDTAETLARSLPPTWETYLGGDAPLAGGRAGRLRRRRLDRGRLVRLRRWRRSRARQAGRRAGGPCADRVATEATADDPRAGAAGDDDGPRQAAREQRTTLVEHGRDGQSSLTITGPTVEITAMDGVLHAAAVAAHGALDEDRGVGQLRYEIAKDLILEGVKRAADPDPAAAVPGRTSIVPTVIVTVPVMTLLGVTDEPGTLEGVGPIDPETARRLAAAAPSFFRLLTHPVTGARLDLDRTAYVAPADLRRWVKLRDDVCRFPGCERAAHRCDVDHAREWQDHGVTAAANLVTLCRPHHNAKSTGIPAETLQPDGSVGLPTPWGRTLTDPPPDPLDPAPDDCPF